VSEHQCRRKKVLYRLLQMSSEFKNICILEKWRNRKWIWKKQNKKNHFFFQRKSFIIKKNKIFTLIECLTMKTKTSKQKLEFESVLCRCVNWTFHQLPFSRLKIHFRLIWVQEVRIFILCSKGQNDKSRTPTSGYLLPSADWRLFIMRHTRESSLRGRLNTVCLLALANLD